MCTSIKLVMARKSSPSARCNSKLPHTGWKVAAGSLDTGVPLSIAGQLLGSRTIRTPGVLCPETAVPGELFFEMLERRQMRVHWS